MNSKIKELRKKNGDTLKSLAEKINYDYSNLSKIERGIYTPSLTLLKKIANIYEVDMWDLLNDEDEEKHKKNEKEFLQDLDMDSKELLYKYNITLDGKNITEDELEFIIHIIRKLRQAVDNTTIQLKSQNNRN
ncbi:MULTISPECIES: helix-turn-helix domain-containing protein [Bacillus cereus group]|uniref:helix-turn-helix domain-containing protein n=2 Tax=Bacillus TaxID=1386 RepID=UPI000BF565A0|nr:MULTISPECIES: helix-turn-helix transcriptional regulator [Bacillus cereus group]PFA21876.1 transcriptional regulator [Bacillus cereus]PFO83697.1 transcriptional regulator [Bacillus cereus]PFR31905.1 transcriptional regulator [Bacillus cereus]PGZ15977.1 transcriptional regulator [Bacillus cereus]